MLAGSDRYILFIRLSFLQQLLDTDTQFKGAKARKNTNFSELFLQ